MEKVSTMKSCHLHSEHNIDLTANNARKCTSHRNKGEAEGRYANLRVKKAYSEEINIYVH